MYTDMYVGIRRTHAPFTSVSLGHKPTAKHETTRVVVLVQSVPFEISLIESTDDKKSPLPQLLET